VPNVRFRTDTGETAGHDASALRRPTGSKPKTAATSPAPCLRPDRISALTQICLKNPDTSRIATLKDEKALHPSSDIFKNSATKIFVVPGVKMILIADDDSDFAETCSMMLESHGYDVSVVLSGSEALAKISDQQPDLLISDCCMPDIGGLQLSKQLKARPAGLHFPILLMSGSLQCRVAGGPGYDAFLRKPFLAEDLLLEVRKLLQTGVSTDHGFEGHK
jgi:CheY-like chemotaxis protein